MFWGGILAMCLVEWPLTGLCAIIIVAGAMLWIGAGIPRARYAPPPRNPDIY